MDFYPKAVAILRKEDPMVSMEKIIEKEDKSIGNIKSVFIAKDLRAQQHRRFSPLEASGNVALGFYRGKAQGVYETYRWLKKKYPKAAKAVFDNLIPESGRRR